MISEYFGLTVTMRPVKPKLRRLRITRLPRGSRAKTASAPRCDAPTMATDLGAISGVRSRQAKVCGFIAKFLLGCPILDFGFSILDYRSDQSKTDLVRIYSSTLPLVRVSDSCLAPRASRLFLRSRPERFRLKRAVASLQVGFGTLFGAHFVER